MVRAYDARGRRVSTLGWVAGWRYAIVEIGGLKQTQFVRAGHGLRAAGDAQFPEYAVGVGLDGAEGDHQGLGDLGIGLAGGNQAQYLQLPLGEGFVQAGAGG